MQIDSFFQNLILWLVPLLVIFQVLPTIIFKAKPIYKTPFESQDNTSVSLGVLVI